MLKNKIKNILIILTISLIVAVAIFSLVVAYFGGIRGVGLLGICFFMTCGIVVVLAQLIPACVLISSIIGGAISSFRKGEAPIKAA